MNDLTQQFHTENKERLSSIEGTLIDQNRVLGGISDDVKETKIQAKITNGRVSSLERWQSYITGGLTVLTILVVPALLFIINSFLKH